MRIIVGIVKFSTFVLSAFFGACATGDLPNAHPAGPGQGAEVRTLHFDFDGHRAFVMEPVAATKPPREWVWYAPTFVGRHPGVENEWLISRLIARGFIVCGVEVGESFGSPAGRAIFSRFYRHMVGTHNLQPKATLLPQSRGGLMLYNWAAENPQRVRCIGGIFPVCDLRSYPGLNRAAPSYGMSPLDLEARLAHHNPIARLAPLARARVPIFHVHGDTDTVVPLEANGLAMREQYTALGGAMRLLIIPGKGHEVVPEFFECEPLLRFLIEGR